MQASEIVRNAIMILAQGWCQGAAARDAMGGEVRLHEVSAEGDGRARINSRATSFSIYGALAKALQDARSACPDVGTMWQVLDQLALAVPRAATVKGSQPLVHPVVFYNEGLDRTKDEVLAFMERAATILEGDAPAEVPEPPPPAPESVPVAASPPAPAAMPIAPEPMSEPAAVIGQIGFPREVEPPLAEDAISPAQMDNRLPLVNWGG